MIKSFLIIMLMNGHAIIAPGGVIYKNKEDCKAGFFTQEKLKPIADAIALQRGAPAPVKTFREACFTQDELNSFIIELRQRIHEKEANERKA